MTLFCQISDEEGSSAGFDLQRHAGRLWYNRVPALRVLVARSSSGPGRCPLKAEITGSNPVRATSPRNKTCRKNEPALTRPAVTRWNLTLETGILKAVPGEKLPALTPCELGNARPRGGDTAIAGWAEKSSRGPITLAA